MNMFSDPTHRRECLGYPTMFLGVITTLLLKGSSMGWQYGSAQHSQRDAEVVSGLSHTLIDYCLCMLYTHVAVQPETQLN